MKNIVSLIFCLYCTIGFCQFKIDGQLNGYSNKPILLKAYTDGSNRLVKKIVTSEKGDFSYNFPFNYKGVLTFEIINKSFEIVSNNEPIEFSIDLDESKGEIDFASGINLKIQEFRKVGQKAELLENTLLPLLTFYDINDPFYNAILDEMSRINNLEKPEILDTEVLYYLNTKEELQQLNSSESTPNKAVQVSKNHLINDDDKLERFGFLTPFLSTYISNSLGTVKTKDDASLKIKEAIDSLIMDVVPETPRGQAIIANVITMLEGNGFTDLSENYIAQAQSMNCKKIGELSQVINNQDKIQVGKVAPNFNLEGSQYNSLYDVKADKKLLIFWASWCPHCMSELPFIKEFYPDFKKEGGEIIGISLDLDEQKYLNTIEDLDWINYSELLKWDGPIVQQYGINSTPTMFLLDKNNVIIQKGTRVSEFIGY